MIDSAALAHHPGSFPINPQILEAQNALSANISSGLMATQAVNEELFSRAVLEPLGSDAVSNEL